MRQHVNHAQTNPSLEIKLWSLTKNFPIPSFPLRYLHSSRLACNRLRCLGLLKPEFSFSISFYSTPDPVSIASIASRTQFERLSYMHMHTLATNILAVEKKKSRHSFYYEKKKKKKKKKQQKQKKKKKKKTTTKQTKRTN